MIGLYLAPRDKQGCVIGTAEGPVQLTGRAAFDHYWQTLRLPQYRIDQLWQAQVAHEKAIQANARERQREIIRQRDENRRKDRSNGRARRNRQD